FAGWLHLRPDHLATSCPLCCGCPLRLCDTLGIGNALLMADAGLHQLAMQRVNLKSALDVAERVGKFSAPVGLLAQALIVASHTAQACQRAGMLRSQAQHLTEMVDRAVVLRKQQLA